MEKCNKIVIFDWGGVIENNNQSYYNISKAIIDIMRKYKCKLTDQEILEVCTNGKKLFNTFIDDDEQTGPLVVRKGKSDKAAAFSLAIWEKENR